MLDLKKCNFTIFCLFIFLYSFCCLVVFSTFCEHPQQCFSFLRTQHDNPHHTRDKQLRRRSSWSDLPSFFKFNKESNITTTQSGKDPIHKDVPTKTVSQSIKAFMSNTHREMSRFFEIEAKVGEFSKFLKVENFLFKFSHRKSGNFHFSHRKVMEIKIGRSL